MIFNRADQDLEVELPRYFANADLNVIVAKNLWTFENATLNDIFPITCKAHGVVVLKVF